MDHPDLVRKQSLRTASQLGFPINRALPALDACDRKKIPDQIVRRLLCLHAVAACAYGFDKAKAIAWLRQEQVFEWLAPSERRFLEGGDGDPSRFRVGVEGMWALAWALGLVPDIDFGKDCDSKFVALLPNLKTGESSNGLLTRVTVRDSESVFAACDLAYCLHWGLRQAQLSGAKLPGKVQPYVLEERRRALEWLICEQEWDEIVLDT